MGSNKWGLGTLSLPWGGRKEVSERHLAREEGPNITVIKQKNNNFKGSSKRQSTAQVAAFKF